MVESFYNSSTHTSTGKTPFEMNGVVWEDSVTRAMRSPMMDGLKRQSAEDILNGMKQAWEDARTMMMMVRRDKMKVNADKHRRDEVYAVGDRVMLSTENLSTHSSKLDDPYIGPFPITRVSDHGVNVLLTLPKVYSKVHQPFHIEKVKRYMPSVIPWGRKQDDRPLPEVVDGEEEYEVEMLLGKRQKEELVDVEPEVGVDEVIGLPSELDDVKEEEGPRRSARIAQKGTTSTKRRRRVRQLVTRYLVKWKGFGEEEATWERTASLRLHAQDAIDEYEYRQAQERGEDVVGVHYMHTVKEAEGELMVHSKVVVGGE